MKISANLSPKTPQKFDFFSTNYEKPDCLKMSGTEVGINLEVNWLCLCDLAHFL